MPTTINLAGVVFTGTDVYGGFIYDKLVDWEGVEGVDDRMKKRPNQPGAFETERTTPDKKTISIEGQFFGADEASAILARELLVSLYSDGRSVPMSVTNAVRTTTRSVKVVAVDVPWTPHKEFSFTIDMTAADPKRYGTPVVVSNTLAVAGTGLDLDFGLILDFGVDFGTTPNDGRLTVVNDGRSETTTTFVVKNGAMPDGVEIVNIATGERLVYVGPIVSGTTLEFDPRTQAVFVNGTNPSGRFLPNPAWWAVPPMSSLEIQFLARGPVTGSPILEATTAPAFY